MKVQENTEKTSTILGFKNELYNYVSIVLPAVDVFIILTVALTSDNPWITTPLNILFPVMGVASVKISEKIGNKIPIYIALSLMVVDLGVMTYFAGLHAPCWIQALPVVTASFFLFGIKWVQIGMAIACVLSLAISNYIIGRDVKEIAGIILIVSVFIAIIERSFSYLFKQQKKIEVQKEIIENKNVEITDSIRYAQHIQSSIFPSEKIIKQNLPESFIFYKPKDIVAGDFYWMDRVNDLIYVAVADCTGHGVPGALVSVVCSNALNRSVNELGIADTGKILDKTRELVLDTFSKSTHQVNDGMDITFCCINKATGEVTWSGANNPLWYFSNGELSEITPCKQPIGKFDQYKPFVTHKITPDKGTTLYMFTDGFADQFGGPRGKKFKYRQLKELILSNKDKTIDQINIEVEHTFNDWKGSHEQVDDVCFMAIRL
jgi:serine phosphatase RsbU (regulator of sigma subunit)